MLHKKFQKTENTFFFESCDYYGKRKSQYERHLQTIKHKNSKCYINATEKVRECLCGNKYKHHSSYFRHKKVCSYYIQNTFSTDETNDLVKTLIKQNNKIHEQMMDIIPKISDGVNTTNINNNIINVQMFLNDKCADAMSIQKFVNSLSITLDDLKRDIASALTNTVIKNLQPMPVCERPIHYKTTSEWYIKDDTSGWQKNTGERLLTDATFGIMRNWLKEFESEYPLWMENDKLRDMYVKIAGTSSSEISERDKQTVLNTIGGICLLDTCET